MQAIRLRIGIVSLILVMAIGWGVSISSAQVPEALSDAERIQLRDFFVLLLWEEESREQRELLDAAIAETLAEITEREAILAAAESQYEAMQIRSVSALRWLQRRGPTSYLDILLRTESLGDFLRKTDLVLTTARHTLVRLQDMREEKQALNLLRDEVEVLAEELLRLQDQRVVLSDLEDNLRVEETRLRDQHGTDWVTLAQELQVLRRLWVDETRDYLGTLPDRFARLADRELDPEDVEIYPSLFRVRTVIPLETLNRYLAMESGLRGAHFEIRDGNIDIRVDALMLYIQGDVQLSGSGVIDYHVSHITFGGLPMDGDLAPPGIRRLQLDLSASLQGMRAQSLSIEDDAIEVIVSLFP